MDLSKQYNNFADNFSIESAGNKGNDVNRNIFYDHIDFIEPNMKLLDLACGDGADLALL